MNTRSKLQISPLKTDRNLHCSHKPYFQREHIFLTGILIVPVNRPSLIFLTGISIVRRGPRRGRGRGGRRGRSFEDRMAQEILEILDAGNDVKAHAIFFYSNFGAQILDFEIERMELTAGPTSVEFKITYNSV